MKPLDFTSQTLDGKYLMTRELGRGGMGTVYLATHLGTERPVAVKIIAPQFMKRAEFVERFRREARAAGRLRHPNVVDVTDFGFADTKDGQVAYLVMEYLDGCTLGEILDEEKNLPVAWTLDILEQVCSAVQEAHHQGIIHRDLKPDNIWLEPNQRGGYTVKVLDFGIAKLEEHEMADGALPQEFLRSTHTLAGDAKSTIGGNISTFAAEASTIVQTSELGTMVSEGGTVSLEPLTLEPLTDEKMTAIYDPQFADQDTVGTQVLSNELDIDPDRRGHSTGGNSLTDLRASAGLTRVGAVLGTPLYMSPEQCRGEYLDTRSDIYSLGVIAYQMLSGDTPFSGDFKEVMESHKSVEPAPLRAKKVRRKMKRAIHLALSKNPDDRPQTAEGFASVLRSRSEGIVGLLRRALVIYSEHLPKFLLLATVFELPVVLITCLQISVSFLRVSGIIDELTGTIVVAVIMILLTLASAFCATLLIGSIVWLVTQYLSVPLRPIRLRPVLNEVRKKWKRVAANGAVAAFTPFIGAIVIGLTAFVIVGGGVKLISMAIGVSLKAPAVGAAAASLAGLTAFFVGYVWCMLITPVAMMENARIRVAFRRSRLLTRRAFATSLAASMIMFLIPMMLAGSLTLLVNISQRAFDPKPKVSAESLQKNETETATGGEITPSELEENKESWNFQVGSRNGRSNDGTEMDMKTRIQNTFYESLIQIFWLPIQIIMLSFSAIIVALLYLKTRLAGGESMNELIERFEDDEKPSKKWQERVRERLIQSGRIPSKS